MDYSPRYGQFRAMLRKVRQEAKMSQTQLAAKLGKPQLYVSRSELGERRIDFLETLGFCSACGVTASQFIERLQQAAQRDEEQPVNRLGQFVGQTVCVCGLVLESRTHNQVTGEMMKFLSIADWTGIIETELFAATYRNYGLATVRYPVLEVEGKVEPFENGRGFSLRALAAREPRAK